MPHREARRTARALAIAAFFLGAGAGEAAEPVGPAPAREGPLAEFARTYEATASAHFCYPRGDRSLTIAALSSTAFENGEWLLVVEAYGSGRREAAVILVHRLSPELAITEATCDGRAMVRLTATCAAPCLQTFDPTRPLALADAQRQILLGYLRRDPFHFAYSNRADAEAGAATLAEAIAQARLNRDD